MTTSASRQRGEEACLSTTMTDQLFSQNRRTQFLRFMWLLFVTICAVTAWARYATLLSHSGKRTSRFVFHQTKRVSSRYTDVPSVHSADWKPWLQRHNVCVSALVFYGRRKYVRVLDKYLKRNMLSAGGLLQEVKFEQFGQEVHKLKISLMTRYCRSCGLCVPTLQRICIGWTMCCSQASLIIPS